ncbi:GNAT family N-acetyltransferase [Mycolicibacterium iranicum]|uniref:N-acetylglutamate synthase, CG3035 family n=1 Tax=Mycolicibacterium iranicum TaxID=912594 RepID=UPI000465BFE1|nr:GNAT family N-acetyltransferase [Mycolicibacterium iranicum]
MTDLPAVGTRVSLRYRLPTDEARPMTDVVGHIVDTGDELGRSVRIRTRHGDIVDVAREDVLAVRVVPEMPVRTGEIRNLEHAAALAWPGTEHQWVDGWLLRFGGGVTRRANSAVPLRYSSVTEIAQTLDIYSARGLPALVSVPDRLLRLPAGIPTEAENLVMTTDVAPSVEVPVAAGPDSSWLTLYERDVPVDILTAVVNGEVGFGQLSGAAVGRVAVTDAPDGTRWAGLSAVHVSESARRRGLARELCAGLLTWAFGRGATRAYVQVVTENAAARALYESMGFQVHHRSRYVRAEDLL